MNLSQDVELQPLSPSSAGANTTTSRAKPKSHKRTNATTVYSPLFGEHKENEEDEDEEQSMTENELDDNVDSDATVNEMQTEQGAEADKARHISLKSKIYDTFGHVLISLYLVLAVVILAVMIAAWSYENNRFSTYMFIVILFCTLISSLIGVFALLNYGRIMDQVNRLQEQNVKYGVEMEELTSTNLELKQSVDCMEENVEQLQRESDALDTQTANFEYLVNELQQISKEQDVEPYMMDINRTFKKMRRLICQNERTNYLTIFYQCAFQDDCKMSHVQYKRFLTRLSVKQRAKFKPLGTFQELCAQYMKEQSSNNDHLYLDLNAFLKIVDCVLRNSLEIVSEEIQKEYTKQQHKQSDDNDTI